MVNYYDVAVAYKAAIHNEIYPILNAIETSGARHGYTKETEYCEFLGKVRRSRLTELINFVNGHSNDCCMRAVCRNTGRLLPYGRYEPVEFTLNIRCTVDVGYKGDAMVSFDCDTSDLNGFLNER